MKNRYLANNRKFVGWVSTFACAAAICGATTVAYAVDDPDGPRKTRVFDTTPDEGKDSPANGPRYLSDEGLADVQRWPDPPAKRIDETISGSSISWENLGGPFGAAHFQLQGEAGSLSSTFSSGDTLEVDLLAAGVADGDYQYTISLTGAEELRDRATLENLEQQYSDAANNVGVFDADLVAQGAEQGTGGSAGVPPGLYSQIEDLTTELHEKDYDVASITREITLASGQITLKRSRLE